MIHGKKSVTGYQLPASKRVARDAQQVQRQSISGGQFHIHGFNEGMPSGMSDAETRQFYKGWQYAAANLIAETVMGTGWEIRDKDRNPMENDHPAVRLFSMANPLMSGGVLTYLTMLDLMMIGKSYWYTPLNRLGEPAEIWPIYGRMEVKLSTDRAITGWTETNPRTGQKTNYEPEEVVWLRFPMPGTLMGGVGAYQAVSDELRMDAQITESEWQAMKQGIWPSAIMKLPASITDRKKRTELVEEFENRYMTARGGVGKVVGIADNIQLDWPPTKPREMGYHQTRLDNDAKILGIMRTPPALLGQVKDVNRATADALSAIFANWTIAPKLTMMEDQINEQVIHPFWGEDLLFDYDDPVPPDREFERVQEVDDLRNYVVTINEVREKRGLDPVPWGDNPIAPLGVAPLHDEPVDRGGEDQSIRVIQTTYRSPFSRRERRRMALSMQESMVRMRASYRSLMRDWFDSVQSRVLRAWDESQQWQSLPGAQRLSLPNGVNRILTVELAQELAEKSRPLNRQGIVIGGDWQRLQMANPDAFEWKASHEAIDRYLSEYGVARYDAIVDRTRRALTETVADGVRHNETMDELRARIVDSFGSMADARATNIATTETTRLWGSSGEAFREVFEIPKKTWVASFVNTRDTHAAADGLTIDADDYFIIGKDRMLFPGDGKLAEENCMCNCAAVGSV